MTYQPFIVQDARTGETLDGMPTPMLISTGGGEAWQQTEGIWRLREERDPVGTEYRKVRVVHVEPFLVDVEVQNLDPSNFDDDDIITSDTVRVIARDAAEARAKAPAIAIERAQQWEDAPYSVSVIRVEKEY